jgi:hypothetical protein
VSERCSGGECWWNSVCALHLLVVLSFLLAVLSFLRAVPSCLRAVPSCLRAVLSFLRAVLSFLLAVLSFLLAVLSFLLAVWWNGRVPRYGSGQVARHAPRGRARRARHASTRPGGSDAVHDDGPAGEEDRHRIARAR